jgi:peptide-methionine (S)-S-oxide reductase
MPFAFGTIYHYYFSMKFYVTGLAILAVIAFIVLGASVSRAQNAPSLPDQAGVPISSMLPASPRPTSAELFASLKKQTLPPAGRSAEDGTAHIPWNFGTPVDLSRKDQLEYAILAGGCFWCLEAVFELVPGVKDVISGYSGGQVLQPSYHSVSTGTTGHAEAVLILYDPKEISYSDLLEIFWHIHDPTTKDRQGYDIGPQYRSAIFWLNDAQRDLALASIATQQAFWPSPIITEVRQAEAFWPAEEYHQDFYRSNPEYGYCQVIISPKIEKVFGIE